MITAAILHGHRHSRRRAASTNATTSTDTTHNTTRNNNSLSAMSDPSSMPPTPLGQQHHHASDVFDGGISEPPAMVLSGDDAAAAGLEKVLPPHVATSPGKPRVAYSFDAAAVGAPSSVRDIEMAKSPAASASRHAAASNGVDRGLQIRFVMAVLMFIGLLGYEMFSFEFKDWRDRGRQPGVTGFTGSALLWALSTLWSLSQVFHCGLHCCSSKFRGFTDAQQLKVVKYLIQIAWGSTIVVIYTVLQLYYDGLLPSDCTTAAVTEVLGEHACAAYYAWPYSHVLTLYGAMYIWELLHEGSAIHNSLALHHFCIVVILHFGIGYYGTRADITATQMQAIGDMGFPQLVAAGLEQPVFAALLLHRFGASPATRTRAFKVAWMSFAVAKALALVLSIVVLIVEWDMAPLGYSVGILAVLVIVVPTQVWSTIVLRKLAKRMEQKGAEGGAAAEAAAAASP